MQSLPLPLPLPHPLPLPLLLHSAGASSLLLWGMKVGLLCRQQQLFWSQGRPCQAGEVRPCDSCHCARLANESIHRAFVSDSRVRTCSASSEAWAVAAGYSALCVCPYPLLGNASTSTVQGLTNVSGHFSGLTHFPSSRASQRVFGRPGNGAGALTSGASHAGKDVRGSPPSIHSVLIKGRPKILADKDTPPIHRTAFSRSCSRA